MADRARAGRSLPDDLTGGTFTITNLGMYDIDAFTPVINLPEAAILGVGRISPKWVYSPASPSAPVLRQMLTLSLVFDHRLNDGAPAARFLQYYQAADRGAVPAGRGVIGVGMVFKGVFWLLKAAEIPLVFQPLTLDKPHILCYVMDNICYA